MLLFAIMSMVLVALGSTIAYSIVPTVEAIYWGVAISLMLFFVMTNAALAGAEKLILTLADATEVTKEVHPQLINIVEEMCIASGLSTVPKIYITSGTAPNAFATGLRADKSAVVVTSGLLTILNRDEVQGVVAHELAHINNRDVQFLTLSGVMLGTIVMVSDVFLHSLWHSYGSSVRYRAKSKSSSSHPAIMVVAILFAFLGPILARLLHFAISRQREYLADATAILYTRYPLGLASALHKISQGHGSLPSLNRVTGPMYISNPRLQLRGKDIRPKFNSLDSTHPPINERIKILERLAGNGRDSISLKHYNRAFLQTTGARSALFNQRLLQNHADLLPQRAAYSDTHALGAIGLAENSTNAQIQHAEGDLLRATQGFQQLQCGCGLKIKIPPRYPATQIKCPKCGTLHAVHQYSEADNVPPQATDKNPAALRSEAVFVHQRTGRSWETFDCQGCGRLRQISPSLNTSALACPHCGSVTSILQAKPN